MMRYNNFSNNIGNQPKPFPPKFYQPIISNILPSNQTTTQPEINTTQKLTSQPKQEKLNMSIDNEIPHEPQFTQPNEKVPEISQQAHNLSVPKSKIIEEENQIRISTELENMMKEKFGKVDEIMLLLKDMQEKKINGNNHQTQQFIDNNHRLQENELNNITPINVNQPIPKPAPKRFKRSYYPIPENRWNELKTNFPELNESHRSLVFSDGEKNYLEFKNKKIELNYKAILKLLAK